MDFITGFIVSIILKQTAIEAEKNLAKQGIIAEVIVNLKDIDMEKLKKTQQNQQQPKKEEPKEQKPLFRVLDDQEV